MSIGFNRHGAPKSTHQSVSGWENSWFGGYTRMIWDHPYIDIDPEINIKPSKKILKDVGSFAAEKLLKMYLLHVKKAEGMEHLERTVEERINFMGIEKKYEVYSMGSESVFKAVLENNPEISPLFVHYKTEILDSSVEMEIKKSSKKDEGGESIQGEKKPGKNKDEFTDGDGSGDERKLIKILNQIKAREKQIWSSDRNLSKFDSKPVFKPIEESIYPYRFSSSEISNAEMILKMLDIDFEPKSDVVKSLRVGKLDVSKISEVPAGNLSVYKQIVEEQDTRPFTVCILCDLSGSMRNNDRIDTQLNVMNSLFLAMREILPPDKLFVYGHSGQNIPEIYTFYSPYTQDYERRISKYYEIPLGQNYDGPVIESIHKRIREINEDRIIFVVLSDGQPAGLGYGSPSDYQDLKRILEKCRRDEFVTVGVGMESFHVEDLYTYSKTVKDLSLMAKEVSSLINRVVRTEFK